MKMRKSYFKLRIAISLLLAAVLFSGCAQELAAPQAQDGETETIVAATQPINEPSPAIPGTELPTQGPTEAPTETQNQPTPSPPPTEPPVDVPSGPVIDPGNALQVEEVSDIQLRDSRVFAWLPDGDSVAVATDTDIIIYGLYPLQELKRFSAPATTLLSVSPAGNILASVDENNTIHIWDVSNQSESFTLAEFIETVTGLAFSPDGSVLAVSRSDNSIELWNALTGELAQRWELPYWAAYLYFSPDGQRLAAVDLPNFVVHILNVPAGTEERSLSWTEHASPALYSVQISNDWETLAWVARGTVQLMNFQTGELGPALTHEDFVSAASMSPNGELIATAAAATVEDQFVPVVILWSVSTGEQINLLPQPEPVTGLAFSPNGSTLAVLTFDNTLRFLAVDNG